jgi:hypothetical protein
MLCPKADRWAEPEAGQLSVSLPPSYVPPESVHMLADPSNPGLRNMFAERFCLQAQTLLVQVR